MTPAPELSADDLYEEAKELALLGYGREDIRHRLPKISERDLRMAVFGKAHTFRWLSRMGGRQ